MVLLGVSENMQIRLELRRKGKIKRLKKILKYQNITNHTHTNGKTHRNVPHRNTNLISILLELSARFILAIIKA